MKRRASEETRGDWARLTFCICLWRILHAGRTLLLSSRPSPSFFPPDFLSLEMLSRARREDLAGDEQRHSAGDKSRISCYGGALVRKAAVPPPPLTFRGRNLSLADDPLKRICPHTRQCTALRAATREVIQRHATSPTRLTWRDVVWRDVMWHVCDARRRDATLLLFGQIAWKMYRKKQSY